MELGGLPVTLAEYPARTRTSASFRSIDLPVLDRIYLPPALTGLLDDRPVAVSTFLEDDNRGVVTRQPVAQLDGVPFYLSVKGVGSATDPFSSRPLDRASAALLTQDPEVRLRLGRPSVALPEGEIDRIITGERWLRGSPYGGQGLEHAAIALAVTERADLTSLRGFRIAPVVKIAFFPPELEERLRSLHWYHRFSGPMVQELRLVPSNVRIYFHARTTVGSSARHVFDQFGIDSDHRAIRFEVAFVRSVLAMLTLYARTLRREAAGDRYFGLDFHDVWLDKDALVAPDGTVYFVDLEGIEEEPTERERVREKIEDQVYRSLYEFLFAFEQIEEERIRRFGGGASRKTHLTTVIEAALGDDPFVRVRPDASGVALEIRNALGDAALNTRFPLVDP